MNASHTRDPLIGGREKGEKGKRAERKATQRSHKVDTSGERDSKTTSIQSLGDEMPQRNMPGPPALSMCTSPLTLRDTPRGEKNLDRTR